MTKRIPHPFTGDGDQCAYQPVVPSGFNASGAVFLVCGESRANHTCEMAQHLRNPVR